MSEKKTITNDEIANMGDEEFMNMDIIPEVVESVAEIEAREAAEALNKDPEEEEEIEEEEDPQYDDPKSEEESEEDDDDDEEYPEEDPDKKVTPKDEDPEEDPKGLPGDAQGKGKVKSSDDDKDKKKPSKKDDDDPENKGDDPEKGEEDPKDDFDYKGAYEKLMKPFKAHGQEVKVKNPEELIQLAQMGADYTKKMMALQPHLKVVRMLENNGILDEAKLSYLIDLDRKDPAAIQKLVKDAGIDPMDIDVTAKSDYQTTSKAVSDAEWTFNSTLEEVKDLPNGREMIIEVDQNWDKASKDALWEDPNILRIMTTHKQDGVYDQIAGEIKRRQTLGGLRSVSFLQAYQQVGNEMTSNGGIKPKTVDNVEDNDDDSSPKNTPRVVDTRTRKKRKAVSNDRKAKAASSPKSAPRKTKSVDDHNPLALSDEEFEKQTEMANRI